MTITQQELVDAGYHVQAAPVDDWRSYDEHNPVPNYFDFDWFSSRHPDLYHKFALSTDGLMDELHRLVDLTGLQVLDCGAGTGRSTLAAAGKARQVTAVDVFDAALTYGKQMITQAGCANVLYVVGLNSLLPFPDNSFDLALCSWSILDYSEAYRVLKPGGRIIELGPAPGALCGELTAVIAEVFPHLITETAPAEHYAAGYPSADALIEDAAWNGLPVIPPTMLHDFTYISDYGSTSEAAAIIGRLYGPVARRYFTERGQSTYAWRLRIAVSRVKK